MIFNKYNQMRRFIVRITENQIRRIIRSVLNTSLLSEAKKANSWEEYVPYTVENTGLAQQDVEDFVTDYRRILRIFLEDMNDPEVRDNPKTNQAFLEFMNMIGFTPNITDSYSDYVKWYKSFNSSEFGGEIRAENGSGQYLSPIDLIDVIMTTTDIYDQALKQAKEATRKAAAENMSEEEIKKGMRAWVKNAFKKGSDRRKKRRMEIKARMTGAKGGDKELDKYDKAAVKTQKNRRKAEKADDPLSS